MLVSVDLRYHFLNSSKFYLLYALLWQLYIIHTIRSIMKTHSQNKRDDMPSRFPIFFYACPDHLIFLSMKCVFVFFVKTAQIFQRSPAQTGFPLTVAAQTFYSCLDQPNESSRGSLYVHYGCPNFF